jgi:hypothetical protein
VKAIKAGCVMIGVGATLLAGIGQPIAQAIEPPPLMSAA